MLPNIASVFTTAECLIFLQLRFIKNYLLFTETKISADEAAQTREAVKKLYNFSEQ